MQFKIGDQVVHPVYGTGQIVSVQEKQFSGKAAGLYYEVALPKLITVWVPVETQKASRLRLVTAKSELDPPPDLPIIAPVPSARPTPLPGSSPAIFWNSLRTRSKKGGCRRTCCRSSPGSATSPMRSWPACRKDRIKT